MFSIISVALIEVAILMYASVGAYLIVQTDDSTAKKVVVIVTFTLVVLYSISNTVKYCMTLV